MTYANRKGTVIGKHLKKQDSIEITPSPERGMVELHLLLIVEDVTCYNRDKCVFPLCGRSINSFSCDLVHYYVSNETPM